MQSPRNVPAIEIDPLGHVARVHRVSLMEGLNWLQQFAPDPQFLHRRKDEQRVDAVTARNRCGACSTVMAASKSICLNRSRPLRR